MGFKTYYGCYQPALCVENKFITAYASHRRRKTTVQEHERVDLPEHDLKAGDVGTVVQIYHDAAAYEIEFLMLNGRTLDVVTVETGQVRSVSQREVLHVRERSL